jgi:hypothetical protein
MRRKKRGTPSSNFTGAESCSSLEAKRAGCGVFQMHKEGFSEELSSESIDSRQIKIICKAAGSRQK